MKLGVLFSGGKDSCYALYESSKEHEISCLLSVFSKNKESYMFHTPNIELTKVQAYSMNIPLVIVETEGKKEKELKDLKKLIKFVKKEYEIEGIVTGAIESVYQATRVQKICSELGLWCFNPLWQKDQVELLNELVEHKYDVIFSGIAGYPLDEKWLGKKLTKSAIKELIKFKEKYFFNPSGEGGEWESFVLDSPMFKEKLIIKKSEIDYKNHAGTIYIKEVDLK